MTEPLYGNLALDELLRGLRVAQERKTFRKIDFYEPYEKQQLFHMLGATKRERLFRAGNQLGKTYAGAAEATYHLTGNYPDWWKGRRWTRPTTGWISGTSAVLTREGAQQLLCGKPGVVSMFGTGMIPKASFVDKPSLSRGVTDAYDTIQVRHCTGGVSTAMFKSYEQGREKFQTGTIDWGWGDEEPPEDVYGEFKARITATAGMLYITFTPLKGMSNVVRTFISEPHPDRADIVMTIYDAKHISPEEREKVIAGYKAHEREARTMGTPMQGEGRVFPVDDALIIIPPITAELIPPFWTKLWGIDFGIGHPFAAALTLWDKDNDCLYVHAGIRMADTTPLMHAAAMRPIGGMVKVAWPKDGGDREKGTGKPLADQYKEAGLFMLPTHATFPDGSISTEAGVVEMYERMISGRFKVSRTLMHGDWGDEFRNYHREKGLIVKKMDDLMSATRIAVMAKRYGTTAPLGFLGRNYRREPLRPVADGVDFDVFSR